MPPKRRLLLCFDAFGTLFKPRQPIAQQYGEVARSLGLATIRNEDVEKSFKAAFKQESKRNPNYGKHNGLNAEKWWSKVIANTFTPLIPPNQNLPTELVPKLLHRFGSKEGYELFPDVLPLFRQIQEAQRTEEDTLIVVGVITNSDGRVPDILTSLGLRVSPLRFPSKETLEQREDYDIHFSVMSYDVGYEKPHEEIFNAASGMLASSLGVSEESLWHDWGRIHVGDDYNTDVQGAIACAWKAVLIDRENTSKAECVTWVDDIKAPASSYKILESEMVVGFRSLEQLAEWLPGGVKI